MSGQCYLSFSCYLELLETQGSRDYFRAVKLTFIRILLNPRRLALAARATVRPLPYSWRAGPAAPTASLPRVTDRFQPAPDHRS